MTRDEIITLAGNFAMSLQDADTLDIFMDDIFENNAALPQPHFVKAEMFFLTSGTDTYSFDDEMLRIVYAIMFDELLSPADEAALDAYAATWQAATGTPVAITQDSITARQYRLYPTPDFDSSPLIPAHGAPWGEDFPDDVLVLIYADDRETDIPTPYAIPLALDATAREFAYPSPHTDIAFAATCSAVAELIYRLIGVIQ
jgi:hypothetical protein